MKVTVNKYLNARIGEASTNAACKFYHTPGDTIEIDDILVGTEIDGNSVWYHCKDDGCYYWSGGIENHNEILGERRDNKSFTQIEELGIYKSAVNELSIKFSKTVIGFKGIAAGYKEIGGETQNDLSLIIYVDQKFTGPDKSTIPKEIDYKGFKLKTDVRPVGQIHFQSIFKDKVSPLTMGGSLAEVVKGSETSYGTRSLIVTKNKKDYLLTCFHVACNSLFLADETSLAKNSVFVNIPAISSKSNIQATQSKVTEGRIGSTYDYALIDADLASLVNSMTDGTPFNNGYYTLFELEQNFLKNRSFMKLGATEPFKNEGAYKAYHASISIGNNFTMSGLIEASNMSDHGDSGAPVIDKLTNKLVGYIIGGSISSTYILPFARLEFSFGIKPKLI